jgi:type I restriction enzyme, S subunit
LWNSTGTGTIGRAALYKHLEEYKRVVADSHVTIVRANKACNTSFLHYFIRSSLVQSKIEDMQSGSTNQVELSRGQVLNTVIPLAPLNEQKRIADKLDRLLEKVDACRERCDRIPLILKRFRQSVLAAANSSPSPIA